MNDRLFPLMNDVVYIPEEAFEKALMACVQALAKTIAEDGSSTIAWQPPMNDGGECRALGRSILKAFSDQCGCEVRAG